jgi:hypothetical protein
MGEIYFARHVFACFHGRLILFGHKKIAENEKEVAKPDRRSKKINKKINMVHVFVKCRNERGHPCFDNNVKM